MTCRLRIAGENLDPDDCARLFPIPTEDTWRKGERLSGGKGRPYLLSGLQFLISDREGESEPLQIDDAWAFMRRHHAVLRAVTSKSEVEMAFLDFSWDIPISKFVTIHHIPPELAALCGANGVGIEFSVFPQEDYVEEYMSKSEHDEDADVDSGPFDNRPRPDRDDGGRD